ncbi:MAG: hypothetical protein IPL28_18540 [Chloroflexi bacterium]|nr:hypothetical protein [Chloroflexota bacterium]
MDRIKPWLPWLIGLGLILSIALIFFTGDEETADPTPTASAVITATATLTIATPTETETVSALPTEAEGETATAEPATATAETPPTATAEPPTPTATIPPTATPSTALFDESGVSLEYPVALGIANMQLSASPPKSLARMGLPATSPMCPSFWPLPLILLKARLSYSCAPSATAKAHSMPANPPT